MTNIRRIGVAACYCDIAIHDGTAYFSGYVPEESAGDAVGAQTADILSQIDMSLAEIGSDKSRVLHATIWLSDIASYEAMNEIWDAWIAPGHAPARVCVESKLADPDYALEIRIIAAV
ncbi:RidA family protein [Microvirga brassicacearum]|uniref:RidA family protein n=1 Tax=Microvirga brassicacearum TaxID=2580413 RepID=A0A5N3PAM5_9HYPH|nr:RidA family protein [Microvirga brassicacearum]KAB0266731.1 RidA family protein [Microvirga brassicacearum]